MLAIVADDLTGALDAAAPFASRGLAVEVALTIDAIAEALDEAPRVLSVNIASREVDADAARRAMAAALAVLPPGTLIFKKIDSRLKGNIAAELDAMPFQSALVAPAIPDFGRVVENGKLTGFGVEASILIADKLGSHAARATIPDISSQAEMGIWLDRATDSGVDLLIGARGLAEALAKRMSGGATSRVADIPPGSGLFVIGSRDPITLAQIDALRSDCGLSYLPAPNGRLGATGHDNGPLVLVQAVPGENAVTSDEVSYALAESVSPSLTESASTLILSGGATAEAVLRKMGITRFRLVGECLPGLGLAHAQGHCIIAKSGGFGEPNTLKMIADRLRGKTG